jgi:hypothetical protein
LIGREWLRGLPKCYASIAKGVQSHAMSMGRFSPSVDSSGGDDAMQAAPPPRRSRAQRKDGHPQEEKKYSVRGFVQM